MGSVERKISVMFPLWSRVRLTHEAAAMFPRIKGEGSIASYARDGHPKVLWDGRKTVTKWSPGMLDRVGWSKERSEAARASILRSSHDPHQ